ncbi:MAG: LytTR family DNA-binding domain-containing protein [Bacteroidota bacterium]
MIRAIIVDDEEKGRFTLRNLVAKNCPSLELVDLCDSVEMAIASILKHQPDLVFLDIEMPFQNGFALLEKFQKPNFDVIFITAYDHYAIKAIKYSALDYLLKPVDTEELKEAVIKIEQKKKHTASQLPDFELLLSNLKLKGTSAKIAIPTFEGLQMINSTEIIKCTANESYTEIVLAGGKKIMVSRILKEYEDLLSDFNFFRVHNSCLINLAHVNKYIKGDGGYVLMSDGESVEVSRRKKNELLHKLALIQV